MPFSVLLIDDDATFRALARRVLTASGLEIAGEAATAADGGAAAERLRPDAIVVDVGLPDGDGVALAALLAALPWSPRILITSVDTDATTMAHARRSGALGFVPKHELPGAGLDLLVGDGTP